MKTLKNIKYLVLAAVAMSLSACNSFLDVKPKGFTIPEYFQDYQVLMNSQSLLMAATGDLHHMMSDDTHLLDKSESTTTSIVYESKGEEKKRAYNFSGGQLFAAGTSDPVWNGTYSRIFSFNVIINNVMDCKDASEVEKATLRAEALVARAYEYLTIVNFYARDYDAATAATDLGIPLILTEDISKTYKRNTVAEVYNQILSDLTTAIPALKENSKYTYYASKTGARSVLARTYLLMDDYAKALTTANEVLAVKNKLVDFKPYSIKPEGGTFGRIINPSLSAKDPMYLFPERELNVENIFGRINKGMQMEVAASQSLLDTYARNLSASAEDKRYTLYFSEDSIKRGRTIDEFIGFTVYAPYLTSNAGTTTVEMYLIAAECEARIGDFNKAVQILDKIRDTRIKNNTALSVSNKEEALKLVIDERRREFAFVGSNNFLDEKRLNREAAFAKDVTHSANGETWTLPANDNRYIFPIPNTVLEHNPDMPQYLR